MRKLAMVSLAVLLSGSAVAAPRLVVARRHAVRLPVSAPVSDVIVGDPGVADVIVINPRTVLVQGKANGQTEIIALGATHRPVWQGDVAVVDAGGGRVTVLSRHGAVDYTCSGSGSGECARAWAPGAGASAGAPAAPAAPSRAVSGAPPVRPFIPG